MFANLQVLSVLRQVFPLPVILLISFVPVFIHISDVNLTLQLVLNSCHTTTSNNSQINTCHLGIIVTEQSARINTEKLAECHNEGDLFTPSAVSHSCDLSHVLFSLIYCCCCSFSCMP